MTRCDPRLLSHIRKIRANPSARVAKTDRVLLFMAMYFGLVCFREGCYWTTAKGDAVINAMHVYSA